MSNIRKSSSIDKKEFTAEQELQETLRLPEHQRQPIRDLSEEEDQTDYSEVESNLPSTTTASNDISPKLIADILSQISKTVVFTQVPFDVMLQLRITWTIFDPLKQMSNGFRLTLISMGITSQANPNLYALREKTEELAERLGQEESLGKTTPWGEVENEWVKLVTKYAQRKAFVVPTIKQAYNDWTVWLDHIYAAIHIGGYSIERLASEIETGGTNKYPEGWKSINWDLSSSEIYYQMKNRCPTRNMLTGQTLTQDVNPKSKHKSKKKSADKTYTKCKKIGHVAENCYVKSATDKSIRRGETSVLDPNRALIRIGAQDTTGYLGSDTYITVINRILYNSLVKAKCIISEKNSDQVLRGAMSRHTENPYKEIMVNITCKGEDLGTHSIIVLSNKKL
ncbi:hypothetical protein NEPAR04_1461 [Nematocida parisii]|nr:hypothetical protein NEPAR03_1660 [Nematocida parisii]KAI5131121.1 hypothetical protein NEPAR08_2338 [Nematocida parisii]KAI5139038.1 hypothetical protein NEAUS07_2573 [Nematocida ausubeli]KAI5142215.1 hypothetical protein NEPAR04_1461 [Nematocida parisii]